MSNITLEERKKYVGASEVSDLFGVGYRSKWQLWLEKAGRIEPEDLSEVEAVQSGRFLEPAIAEWAKHKWDMKLRKVYRYIPHPTIEGFGASLDYESMEGTLVPAEMKRNWWGTAEQGWVIDKGELVDAPLKYLLQCQSQMACTKANSSWLIALYNGNLVRMLIERHPETIEKIEEEVRNFWLSIKNNEEPPPDFSADSATIAALMQVNKELVVDLTSNNHLPVLCAEYQTAAALAKDGEARKEMALAEIRTIIGDAGKVLTDGYTISSSIVGESTISYVRKSYPLTRITARKDK